MKQEAVLQYSAALKAGQKYYKSAVARGRYPYPLVLEDILQESSVVGYADLGLLEVPADAVVGTRYAGRREALAGNFMPLLDSGSEFAAKWMRLCDAHLGDEGIRDPIECVEYLGRFYIQEGNKRFSVLKSFEAPTVPAHVIRIIPSYSDDPAIRIYYEFMHFYALSSLYGLQFRRSGSYAKLQSSLGFAPEHVWTEDERRSFNSAYLRFQSALEKYRPARLPVTPAEILLVWLQLFPLSDIRDLSMQELTARIGKLLPDALAQQDDRAIELHTEPPGEEQNVLTGLLNAVLPHHLNIAFLYAASPETNNWVRAHDDGRKYLEDCFGAQVTVKTWLRGEKGDPELLDEAIADGADVIFATDASMVGACRKAAALHPDVHFLTCALFQPYTGVRMYNGRTYECKFITGAIAGVMAGSEPIGYVANAPVFGTPASVNAFALGARMTNPDARILLDWACLPGDPVRRLVDRGASVISNREIASPSTVRRHFEQGTFRLEEDGTLLPLATPFWDWGRMYERIVRSIINGTWKDISASQAINYWWGMASGVLDVHLSDRLPDGVRDLGQLLRDGIRSGNLHPFKTRIIDQAGTLRCDGLGALPPESILSMDWFCANVDGSLPEPDRICPDYAETVRVLGLDRQKILPDAEGGLL